MSLILYGLSDGDPVKGEQIANMPVEKVFEWLEIDKVKLDYIKKMESIKGGR